MGSCLFWFLDGRGLVRVAAPGKMEERTDTSEGHRTV